jgi:ABC-type antimicrobial peptide transport system ATPase subunit
LGKRVSRSTSPSQSNGTGNQKKSGHLSHVVMAEGEIIEQGEPVDMFNSPRDSRTQALIERYRSGESK